MKIAKILAWSWFGLLAAAFFGLVLWRLAAGDYSALVSFGALFVVVATIVAVFIVAYLPCTRALP